MTRQASLVVCDELYFNMTGKLTVQGMYTGDIFISGAEAATTQLVFLFILDCDIAERPNIIRLQVTLPGDLPRESIPPLALTTTTPVLTDRSKLTYKLPFLYALPTLRVGRISAKVIFDQEEVSVVAPWISPITPIG